MVSSLCFSTVFPNSKKEVEKVMHIFHEIQGVQKCGETLSEMFDISSQSKIILRMKEKNGEIKS